MKRIPILLMSADAGFVDTACFLALQGLFTAHVTGNFVTLGASLAYGAPGGAAKLLALPVFCLMVVGTRLLSFALPPLGLPILRTMLTLKVLLLVLGAVLAIRLGPFPRGDAPAAMLTGMVFVSAMAIQNAAHRIHMASAPPTTLMTGSTTQVMIDIADLTRGVKGEARSAVLGRLGRMVPSVAAFAIGCLAGALLYGRLSVWCFVVPPVLAAPALWLVGREETLAA